MGIFSKAGGKIAKIAPGSSEDLFEGTGYSGFDVIAGLTGEAAADAAKDAARLQKQYANKAVGQERDQFDRTFEQQRPFIEAGVRQLPELERSATAKGLSNDISDILAGDIGSTRQSLIDDNASNVGLRRSASGDLKMTEALGIAEMLNQRRQSLAGKGLTSSGFTVGAGQQSAGNISNLLSGIGESQLQSQIMQGNARAQGLTNLGNLAVGAYDYYRTRPQA